MLPSTPRSPTCSLSLRYLEKYYLRFSHFPVHDTCPSLLDIVTLRISDYEALHYLTFSILLLLPPCQVQIFLSELCSQTPSIYVLPETTSFITIKTTGKMIGLYNLITCHTTATLYFTSSTKCVHLQVVNQFTNRFMRTNYTTLFKSTLLNKYFMQFGTETRSQGRYSEQATG